MKGEILNRITYIRNREGNFSKSTMRWANFKLGDKHISEVTDLSNLNDAELLALFERVIIQANKSF